MVGTMHDLIFASLVVAFDGKMRIASPLLWLFANALRYDFIGHRSPVGTMGSKCFVKRSASAGRADKDKEHGTTKNLERSDRLRPTKRRSSAPLHAVVRPLLRLLFCDPRLEKFDVTLKFAWNPRGAGRQRLIPLFFEKLLKFLMNSIKLFLQRSRANDSVAKLDVATSTVRPEHPEPNRPDIKHKSAECSVSAEVAHRGS